jgi:RNA recognition motif-containing protein
LPTANVVLASVISRSQSTGLHNLPAADKSLVIRSETPFTAYVGNVSFDATNQDLQDFFKDCDPKAANIIVDKLDMKPKGFGFVEFKSHSGFTKALNLSGSLFHGRKIRIDVAWGRHNFDKSQNPPKWSRKISSPPPIPTPPPISTPPPIFTPPPISSADSNVSRLIHSPWGEEPRNSEAADESNTVILQQPAPPYLVAML